MLAKLLERLKEDSAFSVVITFRDREDLADGTMSAGLVDADATGVAVCEADCVELTFVPWSAIQKLAIDA